MRRIGSVVFFIVCTVLAGGLARAQGRGGTNWTTGGYDAQRSFWVRTDPKISPDALKKPGFGFLWKLALGDRPGYLNSLSPMVILDPYTGYRGHKSLGFLGVGSDNIFGIDIDLGVVEWHNRLSLGLKPQGAACPGGVTSAVARLTSAMIQPAAVGRGATARSNPAQSGVGNPLAGATNLAANPATDNAAPRPPARPAAAPAAAAIVRPNAVYAVSGDGMLRTMYVSNGADVEPPMKFLPPDSGVLDLIVVDSIAYAETSRGCEGGPNAVWSLDLASKQVNVFTWDANATETLASKHAGPAFGPDGTLYVTTGSTVAALEPKSLKLKNTPEAVVKQEFTSSPVVFRFGERILAAAATRDGGIHLLDDRAVVGADSQALTGATDFAPGALASWQDPSGTRWILAPAGTAIRAWKVVDRNGVPVVQPGWVSRDMVSPLTPIVVNGVVFAVASGESAVERARRSVPAVLYALDALTGTELWNSGNAITSFVHGGGLSAGGSQIYLGTYDGALYAFGFAMEH